MKYAYHQPPAELATYVRTILILDGAGQCDGTELPLVTTGMQALVCRFEKNGATHHVSYTLFGKPAPSQTWEVNKHTTVIAYFFNPFVMPCLFSVSATALASKPIELSNWNAQKTHALNIQLAHVSTAVQQTQTLNDFLRQQLTTHKKECDLIKYATDRMMYHSGTEILSELLNELNLNERTFQRLFKKYVGITPGHFRRICQFQSSFSQLRAGQFDTLTDVAYDSGFADQSHFIRSFKEFTSTTPHYYLRHGLKSKKT